MKHRNSIVFIVAFCLAISMSASSTSVSGQQPSGNFISFFPMIYNNYPPITWIGPYGGKIVCLAVDPSNTSIIYAGSWGSGVFKSTDRGRTWRNISQGLGNLFIQSLAVDPKNSNNVYLGAYKDKFYRSTDGGQTWFVPYADGQLQSFPVIYAIAIDPINPNNIYIATRGVAVDSLNGPFRGIIYKSTNQGNTWTQSRPASGTNSDFAYDLAILPNSPNRIYAAYHQDGIWRSSDAGASWEHKTNTASPIGRAIEVVPNTQTVYYGAWTTSGVDTRGGIFKSTDGGENWTQKSTGINQFNIYPGNGIAINLQNPNSIYIATWGRGVYKTGNGGDLWTDAGLPFSEIYSVGIDPTSGSNVFAGTNGDSFYAWNQAISTWVQSQTELTGSPVTSMVSSSTDSSILYGSTSDGGVSKSIDHGVTWIGFNNTLPDRIIHNLVAHPTNPNLLFALTDTAGLYRYDLGSGTGWTAVGSGLPAAFGYEPAFGPFHPFFGQAVSEEEILLGINSEKFAPNAVTATSKPLLDLVFEPSNPNTMYLGTSGSGVYKSTNGGNNWSPFGLAGLTVWGLAVDPIVPTRIYAATSAIGVVKECTNCNGNWVNTNLPGSPSIYGVSISAAAPDSLYAATSNGVFKRVSAGDWNQSGLGGMTVTAVAAHPTIGNLVYAGTTSGVYVSYDGGGIWAPGPIQLTGIQVQSIRFDTYPNHPKYVYFTTQTNGTLSTLIP